MYNNISIILPGEKETSLGKFPKSFRFFCYTLVYYTQFIFEELFHKMNLEIFDFDFLMERFQGRLFQSTFALQE